MSFNNISGVEHAANQEYIHRVNVQLGWFDKPVSFLEAMALITTEIVEAWEAHEQEGLLGGWQARKQLKSEFADIYIRLVDDCSRFKADLGLIVDCYKLSYEERKAESFDGVCMELMRRVREVIEAYRIEGLTEDGATKLNTTVKLAHLFLQLQDNCDEFGVDLMSAVSLKMAVNEKRGYRHGGKHA